MFLPFDYNTFMYFISKIYVIVIIVIYYLRYVGTNYKLFCAILFLRQTCQYHFVRIILNVNGAIYLDRLLNYYFQQMRLTKYVNIRLYEST